MVAPPFEWKDFEARDVIDFIFGYSMFLYTDICILNNMSTSNLTQLAGYKLIL